MPGARGAFEAGERRGTPANGWGRAVTFVLTVTLLASCSGMAEKPAVLAQLAPIVAAPPVSAPAEPASPPAVVPAAAPAAADPLARFRGVTDAEVDRRLGRPDFLRRDGPAQIWQYRARLCLLDLFLYDEGGILRVAHVEARSRSGAGIAPRACLDSLASRGAGAVTSRL